jgi:hypothetical protein
MKMEFFAPAHLFNERESGRFGLVECCFLVYHPIADDLAFTLGERPRAKNSSRWRSRNQAKETLCYDPVANPGPLPCRDGA